MKKSLIVTFLLFACLTVEAKEKHLFILSGQSNMNLVKPEVSFIPTVEAVFGKDSIIVVKDAHNAQPIRRWYKQWKSADGNTPDKTGDLYDRLISKVKSATSGQKIASVTFIWMQGERDAKEKHAEVYMESLKGILKQISKDLKRDDVNFVIGRINDHSMNNRSHPHWTKIRKVQEKAAEVLPHATLVDTDDLNGSRNGIHATKEGYKVLGKRFADAAIELINDRRKDK